MKNNLIIVGILALSSIFYVALPYFAFRETLVWQLSLHPYHIWMLAGIFPSIFLWHICYVAGQHVEQWATPYRETQE
ncbi:hypothetical protein ACJU26_09685 [Acidithiobacillus sp. M4-SHS-6]|uniref:hypothetical protein n=1 Tax=Acidithiobacillus sp. M4-SHS-6 TaxID=3383024 RepID=UPI0039BDC9F9